MTSPVYTDLVLEVAEFIAKISYLRPQSDRLLLAVDRIHGTARRSSAELLYLQVTQHQCSVSRLYNLLTPILPKFTQVTHYPPTGVLSFIALYSISVLAFICLF